ncbi:MAG: dihydrofolate reductase [Bacteroidia bacterium]|nr:dihydrofolate reductase [Bacteroidia bacterium]MDW8016105.1 dihydrofolate reductase [Bacteroidia bacterium]
MWSIVAAVSYPERVIGWKGRLPWHLPLELRLFRTLTWGGILVMGRRTWESLRKPLSGRHIWVLGKHTEPHPAIQVFRTLSALTEALREATLPIFFVGGEQIFRWALGLPQVSRLYLTWIYLPVKGDAFFPPFSLAEWNPYRWEVFHDQCVDFIWVEYHREDKKEN